ncbi:hypothetical protein SO802_010062 [Lithocarpus litseifolius]|uniref:Uncharacterized protein n=1 Tax=Lithocarpus litseifolius TaxID=425828 RepID=A0AAW2DHE4_9ROSI
MDSKAPAPKEGQAMLAIEGFTPLILALPAVVYHLQDLSRREPLLSSLSKKSLGLLKALEAALPSPVIISPKLFSLAPNLQTQKGVVIRLDRLTRSGRCYTPEKLENRRKEIGKSTAEPVRNRVTTKEAKEFLKTIRKSDYSLIH